MNCLKITGWKSNITYYRSRGGLFYLGRKETIGAFASKLKKFKINKCKNSCNARIWALTRYGNIVNKWIGGVVMWWMTWIKKELDHISAAVPRFGIAGGSGGCLIWLLDKRGFLKLVSFGRGVRDDGNPPACVVRWTGVPSHAGGLRPGGPPRLNGVLHYFTRGPDWRIF